MPATGEKFAQLVEIMARLRAAGCPWDREQTFDTIKPYLLEETYEVMDAIDRRDWDDLAEELGDLLLQAVFFAQMAAEQAPLRHRRRARRHQPEAGAPPSARLRRRRPPQTADDVQDASGTRSRQPRKKRPRRKPAPACWAAFRAPARAGGSAADRLARRRRRLRLGERRAGARKAARRTGRVRRGPHRRRSRTELEDEIGDMLFVMVNLARFVKVDPEQALRRTNAKFRRRFAHVERAPGRSAARPSTDPTSRKWRRCGRKRSEV